MQNNVFTQQVVFKKPILNVLCNRFLVLLSENFDYGFYGENFVITGSVAKIIQGEEIESVPVIPFMTDRPELFRFFLENAGQIADFKVLAYKDRLQLDCQYAKFEVWYSDETIRLAQVNGLLLQENSVIPDNIL